ncbi:MAG: hypothetical protein KGH49_02230, partial [Candidatus Micrarchaeota archaeon]|nr:hypothetical protein [Candidatus Micrarchaeota archaeon]
MAREVRVGFKDYFLISIIYLAIALVMFWPVAINPAGMITGGVPNSIFQGSGDSYQNLWTLWWVNYAIFTLHVTPYFTHLLYAPIGASLVTETLSPFAALFSLPFQAVSLGFAYNVIFFLDFVLSGLFMFLLADHIVKNRYAAFIAGIVFAFSPFHLMHAGVGHLNWDSIQFLPLFVLLLLRMIEEKKAVYAAGAGVCLALVTFFGDPEQAIIALMFVVMFLLLKLSDKKYRESVLSARFAINSLVVIVVAAVICSPFLVPIAYGIAHGALAAANQYNTIKSYMISSNPILSFFLPSPYNNFFSWISASYSSVYVVNPTERVAYIGYAALALALLAIWGDRNGRFATTFAWVVIALFFAWLSLGPYVQLGSYSDPNSGSVPGIYPAITAIPIANLVREPARFEMVVTLALAILSAIGLKELFAIRKVKDSDAARYLTIIVAIIMLIEYNGIPITQSFINSYFFNLNISSGYNLIAQNSSNFAVMILPTIQNIGENPTVFHPQLYTGLSMYYQTVFRKPIIGGYTSRVNYTQQLQALEIPISVYGSFLQRGINFAYTSPVLENYSNLTLYWLGRYNVAYVPVIKGAYSQQNATVLDNALG